MTSSTSQTPNSYPTLDNLATSLDTLRLSKYGLHLSTCPWSHDSTTVGPDTCKCHKLITPEQRATCIDWSDRFNTEVINAHLPYSFTWAPVGPKEATQWKGTLTVRSSKWTSSVCYSKKEARKELCFMYFNSIPNSPLPSNVFKEDDDSSDDDDDVTVTIATPQMSSLIGFKPGQLTSSSGSSSSNFPTLGDFNNIFRPRPPPNKRPQPTHPPAITHRPTPLPAILPPTSKLDDAEMPSVDTGVVAAGNDEAAGDVGTSGEMVEVVPHPSEKVLLVDQRAEDLGGTNTVTIPIPDDLCAFGDKCSTFSHMTDRWYNASTIMWGTGHNPGEIIWKGDLPIDILRVLGKNPIVQPFQIYSFVRPEMEMLIQVNSTQFHQGVLIMGIRYYEAKDTAAGGVAAISSAFDLLQTDHVIINPATLNTGSIKIPYLSQFDMVQVKNGTFNPALYYCTIYLGCLSPLRTGPNGNTQVSLTRFVKFSCDGNQTRFYGQCPVSALPQFGIPALPQGQLLSAHLGYEPTGGAVTMTDAAKFMVNGVWKPIASVVGGPGMHAMGDALLGAAMVVDDKVDHIIGNEDGDRPNILADGIPTYTWPSANLSHGVGPIQCRKLTIDPGTRTTHPPTSVPNEPATQMSFAYMRQIWGLVSTLDVTASQTAGAVLGEWMNSPIQWRVVSSGERRIKLTPTGLMCGLFEYYVGDTEWRFQVVKSPIASVRLRVIITPDNFNSTDRNDYMSVVFDCEESNEFTVQIPYMSNARVAALWGPGGNNNALTQPGSSMGARPMAYGRIRLVLETPYVSMDTVSNTCQVLVYQRGAENFSMYVPRPLPFFQYVPRPATLAQPQMEERTHTTNLVTPLRPSECLGGAIQFGETPSMKDIMRRSNIVFERNAQVNEGDEFFIHIPVQPGTNRPRYDNQIITPMQLYHDCFRFYRGGMYYTIFCCATSEVIVEVFHDPIISPIETLEATTRRHLPLDRNTPQGYSTTRVNHNLAKEIFLPSKSQSMSFHVPYYGPYGFNVNSYDPNLENITGPLTMANGHLCVSVYAPIAQAQIHLRIYQSMGDDGKFYTFQGTPDVKVVWPNVTNSTYIHGNEAPDTWAKNAVVKRRLDARPTNANPQMLVETKLLPAPPAPPLPGDHSLLQIVQWQYRYLCWKRANDKEYSEQALLVLKSAYNSLKRRQRTTKAVPQMFGVSKDTMKIAAASAVGSLCPPLAGPAYAVAGNERIKQAGSILDNLSTVTDTLRSTAEGIPDFLSKAVSGIQDSISGMFSGVGSGFASACIHLFTLVKTTDITIRIASFAGILVAFGILTYTLYEKAVNLLRDVFGHFFAGTEEPRVTVAQPQMDSDDDDECILENKDSPVRSWIKFLLMAVGSVCGFCNAKTMSAGVAHFLREGMTMANTAEKFLKDNLDMISRFIYWCVGKENPHLAGLEAMKEKKEEIKQWATESLEMCNSHSTERILGSSTEQMRLFELYDKGKKYITSFKDCPREANSIIVNVVRKLSVIVDRVGMRVGRGVHYEPISIWVHGSAGIGKSSCAKHMAIELAKKLGVVCDSDPTFVRAPTTAYWNGYTGQPIVIIDDWGAIQEPSAFAALLADFVGICSSAEYNPQFAAIEEKDRVVSPRILVSCSNVLFPTHNTICDRTAIYRRRDLCVTTRLAKWFVTKYPGIKTASDPRITKEDRDTVMSKYGHLEFHVIKDPLTVKAYEASDETLNWQTLDQVMKDNTQRLVSLDETRRTRAVADKAQSRQLCPEMWLDRMRADCDDALKQKVAEGIKTEEATLKDVVSDLVKLTNPDKTKSYAEATTSTPQMGCGCDRGYAPVERSTIKTQKCLHCFINKQTVYCDGCERWTLTPEDFKGKYWKSDDEYYLLGGELCCDNCSMDDAIKCRELFDGWLQARNLWCKDEGLPWEVYGRPKWCDLGVILTETQRGWLTSFYSWVSSAATSILNYLSVFAKGLLTLIIVFGSIYTLYRFYNWEWAAAASNNAILGVATTAAVSTAAGLWQGNVYEAGKAVAKSTRVAAIAGRIATGQDARDIKHLLHRNTIRLLFEDGSTSFTVKGLGICNRFALIPYHIVARVPTAKIAKLVTNGNSEVAGLRTFKISELNISRIEGVDLAVVEFPRCVPCFRSVLGLLPRMSDANAFTREATLIESPVGDGEEQLFTQFTSVRQRKELVAYDLVTGRETMELRGFCYPKQAAGMCGAILFDDKHNKIMGMHVCAIGDEGCAQAIARDWFDSITVMDVAEPEVQKEASTARVRPNGDFIPLSAIPQEQVAFSPAKTSIVRSPCYAILSEPSRIPVNMKTDGDRFPGHLALQKAVEKGTTPTTRWRDQDIKVCVADLKNQLFSNCQPLAVRDVRSLQEAILGVPGADFMESIRLSTSPGYPLNYLHKSSSKATFVEIDDNRNLIGLHKDLAGLYTKNHNYRLNNVIPYSTYFDFLKDERLRPGKAPRLINGCPFDETIEWRRYCLDFFASYTKSRFDSNHAIGINVRSGEWTKLADRLIEKSPHIVTGDYSNFGPTLDPELVLAVGDIICEWYEKYADATPETTRVRKVLFEGLAFSKHVAGDLAYQVFCGSPSGNPFTAQINSLVNALYIRLVWLSVMHDTAYGNLVSFYKNMYFCVYGDDFIAAVHPSVSHLFNCSTMSTAFAKHGIRFTDVLKSTINVRPYCTLLESSFLKHSFIPHPDRPGFYLAALEQPVIEDVPSFIHTPCPDPDQQALVNCDQTCRLAYSWGRDYHKKVVSALTAYWQSRGRFFSTLTWEQNDDLCFGSENGDPTFITGLARNF